jgi:hypothetical protein
MKIRSNIAAAVCWHGLFLPVVGWERRIVVLVDCFMCMVCFGAENCLWSGGAPSDRA